MRADASGIISVPSKRRMIPKTLNSFDGASVIDYINFTEFICIPAQKESY